MNNAQGSYIAPFIYKPYGVSKYLITRAGLQMFTGVDLADLELYVTSPLPLRLPSP